jgi:transposase-like protein
MFEPPRCPNPSCTHFQDPQPGFFVRKGSYRPKCRAHAVPRFKCRACELGFSRQTFRADYRDHKPSCNAAVIELLTQGLGFRGAARIVGLSRRCLELKARKASRNAAWLDRNLQHRGARWGLVDPSTPAAIQFDELETYEGGRRTRPLTIALAIDARTRFHYGAVAAPIRPRGKMTDARRAAIAASEAHHGPRRDRSRAACRIVLGRAARLQPAARTVELFTDEKSTYPGLAAKVFRADASGTLATDTLATGSSATGSSATGAPAVELRSLVHLRTKSVEPRTTRNPLFPINSEEADMRDKLGRLRRESWLVSKMCKYLNLHLALYSAWRNWARPRFNRDRETPGQLLGLADRPLRAAELIGWRQDWGALSPCPFGCGSHAPRD